MNLKYEVGQTVKVEANKTVVELMESEIKSITVCSTGAKYLTSKGAFSEEQLDAFALKAQPIAPQEEKAKFKVGQRVIATDNIGRFVKQIATIFDIDKSDPRTPFKVKFDKRGLIMWCHSGDVEPYTEPEQPKSKYESMSNDELKEAVCNISGLCCPTLSNKKRKSDCPFYHTQCEVTNENRSEIIQYLIDEDTPEPEKEPEPVYYSGKVVCVKTDGDGTFTVGKVYEFIDGQILDNKSHKRPTGIKMKSLNDEYLANWYYSFIPYLGEA